MVAPGEAEYDDGDDEYDDSGNGRWASDIADSTPPVTDDIAGPDPDPDPASWAAIGAEWGDIEFGRLADRVGRIANGLDSDLDALTAHAHGSSADPIDADQAALAIATAFDAADNADDRYAIALFTYALCLRVLEDTEDYSTISAISDGLTAATRRYAARFATEDSAAEVQLLELIADLATQMKPASRMWNALSCSCPVAFGEAAAAVAGISRRAEEREGRIDRCHDDMRAAVLRPDIRVSNRYHQLMVTVGDAVARFVELGFTDSSPLDAAISAIDGALAGSTFERSVQLSELRSHRATLIALAGQSAMPTILVNSAVIDYVFPFAVTVDSAGMLESVMNTSQWSGFLETNRPAVREARLGDVWLHPDRDLRESSARLGVAVSLPDIEVETTAPSAQPISMTAEIRLSPLGVHHLCLSTSLVDQNLHDINQAMRRASLSMGAERVRSVGCEAQWERISDYAVEAIATICNSAGLGSETIVRSHGSGHTILQLQEVSIAGSDGSTSTATIASLESSFGSRLLFNPVRHMPSSLEEWARYPAPAADNLLAHDGYGDELLVHTDNTTVLFAPSSAQWAVAEYRELVQFTVAVPSLLESWSLRLRQFDPEPSHGDLGDGTDHDELERRIKHFQGQQQGLIDVESYVRRQLVTLLHSTSLVRGRSHRNILDRLWTVARLDNREAELQRELDVVALRQQRYADQLATLADRRRQKSERVIQIVGAAIAALSAAEVLTWANSAFNLGGLRVASGESTILAVVFIGAVLFMWWRTRALV